MDQAGDKGDLHGEGQETQKAGKLLSRAEVGMGAHLAMDRWEETAEEAADGYCREDAHTGSVCRLGFQPRWALLCVTHKMRQGHDGLRQCSGSEEWQVAPTFS